MERCELVEKRIGASSSVPRADRAIQLDLIHPLWAVREFRDSEAFHGFDERSCTMARSTQFAMVPSTATFRRTYGM
jgi:hypothetical protein